MGAKWVVLLIVLLGVVGGLFYFLLDYTALFYEERDLEGFSAESLDEVYANGTQFYPNLRYRDRNIGYWVSNFCDDKREIDVRKAFGILEEDTVLRFTKGGFDSEIKILCSDIEPEASEEGHFVAGEGGPSEIYDLGSYNVVFSGKVALYRDEKCGEPLIALHEIIHALGFDHNDNKRSIMYPLTNCNQKVDDYIIDKINELYSADSLADLEIIDLDVSAKGRYLNFDINVSNNGLKDAEGVTLVLVSDGKDISEFDLGPIKIGVRKFLGVDNVRLPRNLDQIEFRVVYVGAELDKNNNVVVVDLGS